METIQAVIFDWGGVLIEDPAAELMRYCAEALNVPVQQYIKAHRKFDDDFVTGKISEEQFFSKVCSELKKDMPKVESLWSMAFEKAYRPREDMFALADELQENGYKTAVLSNTEQPSVRYFHQKGYDQIFDTAVFSCLEGMKKPDKRIYDLTIGRLGLSAGECIFIDDRSEFVAGAIEAGLRGIVFENTKQLIKELNRLGVNTD
jgi:epoxide hydrolase-like predicted phosphatase